MESTAKNRSIASKGCVVMRDNLERVTIVLTKEQHQRFKEFANKCHGSLSQFLRMAGENEADDNKHTQMLNLRPIIKKLEKNSDKIKQIEEKLNRTEKGTEYIVNKIGNITDKIGDDIEKLLLHKPKLSIPEIGTYLPYTQEEIISAIERLEEKFVVTRIRRDDAPSRWKIRGDK